MSFHQEKKKKTARYNLAFLVHLCPFCFNSCPSTAFIKQRLRRKDREGM
jgi:hypothetical protein